MNQITLPNTNRTTSQLGFGCSSLMGSTSRKQSLALLEAAFHAGIRHFDVAPMYGYGAAEPCLGEFAARHPGQLSLTSKYGIQPPSNPGPLRLARRLAANALKHIPALKKRLASAANSATAAQPKAPFTAAALSASLDQSLRNLRTDRLDLFLLHDAEAPDLTNPTLLPFLQNAIASGKIGAFGCGSDADKIPALLAHQPAFCPVIQFEWSILDAPLTSTSTFTLHHRTLSARFPELQTALTANPTLRNRWSAATNTDLARPGTLAALMLKAALVLNPGSIILVSSRNPAHIHENARVAADPTLEAPARALHTLARTEAPTLLRNPQ